MVYEMHNLIIAQIQKVPCIINSLSSQRTWTITLFMMQCTKCAKNFELRDK
uniref:Uncharacterized protein n=1 Tax=Arundo donax TaxID=35708 RepID=A0A0A9FC85_ARUDO